MNTRIFVICVALLATACSPRVHHQGKAIKPADMEKVVVGQHTKRDVLRMLGSPSLNSLFNEDRWYYSSKTTQTTAFLTPVTAEQNVYVVHFNPEGLVEKVDHLGLEDAQKVSYVARETPTTGHETSVLQQIFGNFGRISRTDPDF